MLPLVILIVLGGLWGVMLGMGKIAIPLGVPPIAFAFWTCVGGAVSITALTLLRGQRIELGARYLRYYAISGLISNAYSNSLAFLVVVPIGAGLTGVLYALSPLFTYGIAFAVGLERWVLLRAAGIGLGLVGTLMIVLPQSALPSEEAYVWLLIGLTMPLALAIGNVYRAWAWPPGASSLTLAVGLLTAAALWLLPVMAVTGDFYLPLPVEHDGDWATIGVMVASGVIFILYFELQRLAGPVYFSQISYMIAASGLIVGYLMFDEVPSGWVWGAIGVIFAGILLVNAFKPAAPATGRSPDEVKRNPG